jgi:hypothetical protein
MNSPPLVDYIRIERNQLNIFFWFFLFKKNIKRRERGQPVRPAIPQELIGECACQPPSGTLDRHLAT